MCSTRQREMGANAPVAASAFGALMWCQECVVPPGQHHTRQLRLLILKQLVDLLTSAVLQCHVLNTMYRPSE